MKRKDGKFKPHYRLRVLPGWPWYWWIEFTARYGTQCRTPYTESAAGAIKAVQLGLIHKL